MKDKINKYKNHIFCGLVTYLAATSFINQTVYAKTSVIASLMVFAVLFVIVSPDLITDYVNRDADLILLTIVVIAATLCAILSHSGMGAILIPSDMAMIGYASKKIRLGRPFIVYICFVGACPVALWYSHVRWSYNFNMAGFTFMLMSLFALILYEKMEIENRRFIGFFTFVTAFILSMLYHSRTVMAGMASFAVIYLLYDRIRTSKVIYYLLFAIGTLGQVGFTGLYILLSGIFGNKVVLYKEVFSGREDIWRELWEAFLKKPLTGIGSAYELKSLDIFEVHNGLFDILAVHGIIVFALIMIVLLRLFARMFTSRAGAAVSAAFAMLFTSFFENFFIVPPYNLLFMCFVLFALAEKDAKKAETSFAGDKDALL